MKAFKIDMWVYAESQAEAEALQQELLAFVQQKREQGIAVTASRLLKALQTFKDNIFLTNYLR